MSQRHRFRRATTGSPSAHWTPTLRHGLILGAALLGSAAAQAQPTAAEGLRWTPGGVLVSSPLVGPWTSRFGWSDSNSDPALSNPVTARLSWQWLNDYRFSAAGGLRATGGVLGWLERSGGSTSFNATPRLSGSNRPTWAGGSGAAATEGLWATPYVGLGFDSAAAPRSGVGGWGLSADVGWVTRRSSGQGFRLGAQADAEDGWRALRLAPMLQLGVSYAF
jgi:hypothetical protein